MQCPAEGQVFQVDCVQENFTCSNFPNRNELTACYTPKCSCPSGQALDEKRNKCVNISECSKCIYLCNIHFCLSCNIYTYVYVYMCVCLYSRVQKS